MLDSVKIRLSSFQYGIIQKQFDAHFTRGRQIYDITPNGQKGIITVRNAIIPEGPRKKWGGYFPRISHVYSPFQRQPYSTQLVIELSVPKFLYGSSMYEFAECDIGKFADKLHEVVWDIGITLNAWRVHEAIVERLDYCKNFQLPPAVSGQRFFGVVRKYELKNTADFGDRDYANGKCGEYVRFFQNNKNLRVYEKVAEIEQNQVTSVEAEIARNPPFLALPRMELACHDSRTFHSVMTRARIREGLVEKAHYTVDDLFKERLSKRVRAQDLCRAQGSRQACPVVRRRRRPRRLRTQCPGR